MDKDEERLIKFIVNAVTVTTIICIVAIICGIYAVAEMIMERM